MKGHDHHSQHGGSGFGNRGRGLVKQSHVHDQQCRRFHDTRLTDPRVGGLDHNSRGYGGSEPQNTVNKILLPNEVPYRRIISSGSNQRGDGDGRRGNRSQWNVREAYGNKDFQRRKEDNFSRGGGDVRTKDNMGYQQNQKGVSRHGDCQRNLVDGDCRQEYIVGDHRRTEGDKEYHEGDVRGRHGDNLIDDSSSNRKPPIPESCNHDKGEKIQQDNRKSPVKGHVSGDQAKSSPDRKSNKSTQDSPDWTVVRRRKNADSVHVDGFGRCTSNQTNQYDSTYRQTSNDSYSHRDNSHKNWHRGNAHHRNARGRGRGQGLSRGQGQHNMYR